MQNQRNTSPLAKISQRTGYLLRALKLVWDSGPAWSIANIGLILVQGVLPLLPLYLTKRVIDLLFSGLSTRTTDGSAVFAKVLPYIIGTGVVLLVMAALRQVAQLVIEAQTITFTDYIFKAIHTHSVELDLAYYENTQYYDMLYRAQTQASSRPPRILSDFIRLAQSSLSLLTIIWLLISFNLALTLILVITLIPGLVVRLRFSRELHKWQHKRAGIERKAGYFDWLLTSPAIAKEIRLFGLGHLFSSRFQDMRRILRIEQRQMSMKGALADLFVQTSTTLAVIGAYGFIAYEAASGKITLGDVVMYYQVFQRGQGFMQDILTSLSNLYEHSLFVGSLYEFLDLQPQIVSLPDSKPVPRPMREGIAFENVSFQYPGSNRMVLEQINLNILPGEIIALVGANGAGKTTLIRLLCRLYDPTDGAVKIDGTDIRQLNLASLRAQVSVIFQDFVRYYLTAGENIWLGNVDLEPEPSRIADAAERAGADTAINRLRRAYDTSLGKWLADDGEELSGGEWQKVALARAFFREAQIIVLDEPSSALDPEAEFEIFSKFRSVIGDKSAVLISHRLSTVRMANRIYVLDQGRIVESGTHDELMQLGDKYANLFETQAQYYAKTPISDIPSQEVSGSGNIP